MRGSSILDARGLRRFDLDIVSMGGPDFTVTRFQFHMRRDPDGNSLDLMVSTDGFQTGTKSAGHLQLYVTLAKAEALMPLLRGEASWPEAAGRWRSQGGTESNRLAADQTLFELLKPLY